MLRRSVITRHKSSPKLVVGPFASSPFATGSCKLNFPLDTHKSIRYLFPFLRCARRVGLSCTFSSHGGNATGKSDTGVGVRHCAKPALADVQFTAKERKKQTTKKQTKQRLARGSNPRAFPLCAQAVCLVFLFFRRTADKHCPSFEHLIDF